ncbi:unnamed protein product, partial [Nesidiocoris tenuis]
MDKKSKKGILVGYENWDGYRIWYPDDNKILRSRDIVFDEQVLIPSRGIVEIKIDESTQTEIETHPDHDDSEEVAADEEGACREDESDQSEHFPQLRDRSLLKTPNRFQASTNFAMSFVYKMEAAKTPETYRQALESEDREHWKKAMDAEMKSFAENETWIMQDLPPGKKAVACKWVFKIKTNPDGSIERYKARLVAKGFTQRK